MKKVRIVVWGLGAMGSGMAKALLARPGVEIVGAIDRHEGRMGRPLGQVLGIDGPDINIEADPQTIIVEGSADLAIIATASFTTEVYQQLEMAAKAKMNIITIAEEMAFPAAQQPELAKQLDQLAKENNVTILGTGINPGFVLDTLIIAMTGVCLEVESIKAVRINDLSPFGPTVMHTQGVGTTPEEFAQGVDAGTIVGHVGFPESMEMIAAALGWKLDSIEQTKEPIVSTVYRETPHVTVQPGMVAGCKHIANGKINGKTVITLEHPQQVRPELEEVETGDYIYVTGTPGINLSIKPEIPGGIGTMAMAINMIPQVLQAGPGLKTMKDLPIPAAVLGDIRDLLTQE